MLINTIATVCLFFAVAHTFLVKWFQQKAKSYPPGSILENFFHLLGEVEVVFGVWAGVFLLSLMILSGGSSVITYLDSRNFSEPAFVFVILVICSSKPLLVIAEKFILSISRILPMQKNISIYATTMIVGPLLGSLITEPAAMTVTALILLERFYKKNISKRLMYSTLGLLFVNISIGGTLTPFAAPPILMVAKNWNWDLAFMLKNFGWKAILAITISTSIVVFRNRLELKNILEVAPQGNIEKIPHWISLLHLTTLGLVIASSHFTIVFSLIFLFFLGLANVTKEYQEELKIREGLLVAFFLTGIVILGGPQQWWLEPIIAKLDSLGLYLGAMGLTSITDNAALTYLGSQIPTIAESSKYALVAGSVVGGGLTVIANAPNPAGYGILNDSFGVDGISPLYLFVSAIIPTIVSAICFWI